MGRQIALRRGNLIEPSRKDLAALGHVAVLVGLQSGPNWAVVRQSRRSTATDVLPAGDSTTSAPKTTAHTYGIKMCVAPGKEPRPIGGAGHLYRRKVMRVAIAWGLGAFALTGLVLSSDPVTAAKTKMGCERGKEVWNASIGKCVPGKSKYAKVASRKAKKKAEKAAPAAKAAPKEMKK
jgi:hypothetical protein